jgi:predicted transcriptional regulator
MVSFVGSSREMLITGMKDFTGVGMRNFFEAKVLIIHHLAERIMKAAQYAGLSKRERQVVDIVHEMGRANVADIMVAMPEAPTNGAIRSALRVLREKGLLKVERDGKRYVYLPAGSTAKQGRSELQHTVKTFFKGSVTSAVSSLLELKTSDEELAELEEMVRQATKERG